MSENLTDKSEKIATNTEEIDSSTEKIDTNSEKITSETEKIAEIMPEKIRHKGQRGPDKTPRRFNQNSLRNLKQFKTVVPEKTENSGKWNWLAAGIPLAALIGIVMWRIYESRKENTSNKELE